MSRPLGGPTRPSRRKQRSQQRYSDYLSARTGLSFIEWLREEARIAAEPEPICIGCNGSGEGQYDGTRCWSCGGCGVERARAYQ